jgi:hypothetical protein
VGQFFKLHHYRILTETLFDWKNRMSGSESAFSFNPAFGFASSHVIATNRFPAAGD